MSPPPPSGPGSPTDGTILQLRLLRAYGSPRPTSDTIPVWRRAQPNLSLKLVAKRLSSIIEWGIVEGYLKLVHIFIEDADYMGLR